MIVAALGVVFAGNVACMAAEEADAGIQRVSGDDMQDEPGTRLDMLIDALARGSHLRQVIVQEEGRPTTESSEAQATPAGTGDPALFSRGDLSMEEVKRLAALSSALAGGERAATIAWVRSGEGMAGAADVAGTVTSLCAVKLPDSQSLPYNMFRAYLLEQTGGKHARSARALANILQESADIKSTGPEMTDMVTLYYDLGLKVNFAQLGFDVNEALACYIGGRLAERGFGKMPDWLDYKSNTGFYIGWAIMVAENMGDKATGRRDAKVLGRRTAR